jgi:hypothetical protein
MTDLSVPGTARAKLNQGLAPKDGQRSIQMDSTTMGSLVNGQAAYFNPTGAISEGYKEGLIARRAMADFYENERVWSMTNGNDVTGTTDAAALVTDGGNTIDMHTTVAVADQRVGMVFTLGALGSTGVYPCHPETKQAYPQLQQFVITAIGASTTTIAPQIYLTGPKKNVCNSTGGDLVPADFNSKTLTFVGSANTSYVQSLMYHKEAFQFVTAPFAKMDTEDRFTQRQQDGISMSVWLQGDIRSFQLLCRIDIIYGFGALRPEWASRLVGS